MPLLNWNPMTDWRFEDEWKPEVTYHLTKNEIDNWVLKYGIMAEKNGFFWNISYQAVTTGGYTVKFVRIGT